MTYDHPHPAINAAETGAGDAGDIDDDIDADDDVEDEVDVVLPLFILNDTGSSAIECIENFFNCNL